MSRLDNRIGARDRRGRVASASDPIRLADEGVARAVTDNGRSRRAVAASIPDAGGRAVYRRLDVTEGADWADAIGAAPGRIGRLDVLVNNAGVGDLATIEETSLESYSRTIAITQTSVSWA